MEIGNKIEVKMVGDEVCQGVTKQWLVEKEELEEASGELTFCVKCKVLTNDEVGMHYWKMYVVCGDNCGS